MYLYKHSTTIIKYYILQVVNTSVPFKSSELERTFVQQTIKYLMLTEADGLVVVPTLLNWVSRLTVTYGPTQIILVKWRRAFYWNHITRKIIQSLENIGNKQYEYEFIEKPQEYLKINKNKNLTP